MAAALRSPLDGIDRLVVDGTNLLYRIGAGSAGVAAPPAALIGRVRAAIPPAITIELVFDGIGHGVKGRVAQGMFVRYAGRQSADEQVLELSGAVDVTRAAAGGVAAVNRALVVTDDRELRARLLARGVRSVPVAWLLNRLDLPRLSSPAPGNRRPPAGSTIGGTGSPVAGGTGDADDRPGWRPGRGATSKTGPAHRVPRHRRHPRHGT